MLERDAKRLVEWLLGILEPQPMELLEQARGPAGVTLLEGLDHGRHLGRDDEQTPLLLDRRPGPALSPSSLPFVTRKGPALPGARLDAVVLADEGVPIEDA